MTTTQLIATAQAHPALLIAGVVLALVVFNVVNLVRISTRRIR